MITVLVSMETKPEREDECKVALGALLDRVREEPGCRGVHWGGVMGEPHRIAIVERYADQAALEAHQGSRHMAELGPNVMSLCAGAPSSIMFEEV